MQTQFPPEVKRLFWGDNLDRLSFSEHKDYIISTVLEKGDEKAVKWLFQQVSTNEIKSNLDAYKLSPKSKNFWKIYL